jgi:hypothetical protein
MSHLELGAQLSKHFAGPDVLDVDPAQHIRCDKRFHFSRSTIAGADRQAEVAASNVARIRCRLNADSHYANPGVPSFPVTIPREYPAQRS